MSFGKRCFCLFFLALFAAQIATARRIGVLLPFSGKGNMRQTMAEFYRGFLMAADSARVQGGVQEIFAIDCGTTAQEIAEVLSRGQMAQMECIVGPGLPAQADVLAAFCSEHDIQLFMPFNTPVSAQKASSVVFQNVAGQETVYASVVQLLMENMGDANFVLLRTDKTDAHGTAFQNAIRNQLNAYGMPVRILNVNSDDMAIEESMSITRRNVIVPDSPSEDALQQATKFLAKFLRENPSYGVSLVGYPEWLAMDGRLTEQLHSLDTYVFNTFYNNPLSGKSVRFNQLYQKHFGKSPSTKSPSLAMLGFDVGTYVMQVTQFQPLQHGFAFQQDDDDAPHVNRFVQLVHFGRNNLIEQVK